jgi:tetratricopeptide (TPR) repeat protein
LFYEVHGLGRNIFSPRPFFITLSDNETTLPFPRREGGLGELGQNLQKARRALQKFNLIKRTKKDTYQLHELIREFFQDKRKKSAEADKLQQAFAQAMVKIAQTIPDSLTLEHIAKVQDAIPHLAEVAKTLMSVSQPEDLVWLKLEDIGWPSTSLGRFYKGQGLYALAEPMYLQALELRQRLLGENHPDLATSLNNLALLYKSQGRYTEAEPLYLQALELRQRLLGENHPNTVSCRKSLQILREHMGRNRSI